MNHLENNIGEFEVGKRNHNPDRDNTNHQGKD